MLEELLRCKGCSDGWHCLLWARAAQQPSPDRPVLGCERSRTPEPRAHLEGARPQGLQSLNIDRCRIQGFSDGTQCMPVCCRSDHRSLLHIPAQGPEFRRGPCRESPQVRMQGLDAGLDCRHLVSDIVEFKGSVSGNWSACEAI